MKYIFILLIFLISNSAYSGGSEKHIVFFNENKEIVKRIQNCSTSPLTKDIFLQYINRDGTLEEPDGYVYHSDNINVECVDKIFSSRYDENASITIKNKKVWYFYVPQLSDEGGINTQLVEANDDMIFIDISVGYTHIRNFIYNTKTKDTIFINNGVATLEKDYILIEENKSYKPNFQGAFWHEFKINYNNEVIEIINAEKSDEPCTKMSCVQCFTEDEYLSEEIWIIGDNVRDYLEKNKPKEWCVYY